MMATPNSQARRQRAQLDAATSGKATPFGVPPSGGLKTAHDADRLKAELRTRPMARCARRRQTRRRGPRWLLGLVLLGGGMLWDEPAFAQAAQPTDTVVLSARARKAFLAARKRFQTETNSAEAAWHFGRACFDWADFAENDAQRESVANEGIAACRKLVAKESKLVAGYYYLGMNLGQLARTKLLGALKIVEEMEQQYKSARELDAKFDYAGPDRNLGLLYFEAPGWPASIGDKKKARQHLERAVASSPEYPENRLCLLEAYVKWGENNLAQRDLKALEKMLPQARQKFAGEDWAGSWLDWEQRRQKIREKLGETSKSLESPRGKRP